MKPALALLSVLLLALLLLASRSNAQWVAPDDTVRALSAAPVDRHGTSSFSPVVMHRSGDVIVAAEGVLRVDVEGRSRWHVPDVEVTGVATSPDGSIFSLAREPYERPVTLRVARLADDGSTMWTRVLHRGRVDRRTYPDIAAAPDGDVLTCATVLTGRGARRSWAVMIDRLAPDGTVRWSRAVVPSGECGIVAVGTDGDIYWAGHVNDGGGTEALIERLDPGGNLVWSRRFTGNPLPMALEIGADGSVVVGGAYEGADDVMPGDGEHIVPAVGYTVFVTRLDPGGRAAWAWTGDHGEVASILLRGEEVMVVDAGYLTRLGPGGVVLEHRRFGYPVHGGIASVPYLSVTGAVLDARGQVILAGGLPEPMDLGFDDFYLWGDRPYTGPRGAILGRPGW